MIGARTTSFPDTGAGITFALVLLRPGFRLLDIWIIRRWRGGAGGIPLDMGGSRSIARDANAPRTMEFGEVGVAHRTLGCRAMTTQRRGICGWRLRTCVFGRRYKYRRRRHMSWAHIGFWMRKHRIGRNRRWWCNR